MTRIWRLRPRGEFERIRQNGRSWPHRFFILIVLPQPDRRTAPPRIGIAAGKKLGGAVTRNRYKRLMREAVRQVYLNIPYSVDLILIARAPIADAGVDQLVVALRETLQRAKVWREQALLAEG